MTSARGALAPMDLQALLAARSAGLLGTGDMRNYQPSLRDRLAEAAAGAGRSMGLGDIIAQRMRDEAAIGADFMPGLGAAIGGEEAGRDIGAGNYLSGGLGLAMSMIPGGKAVKGIKIGTGVGAQALQEAEQIAKMAPMSPPPKTRYGFDPDTEDYETFYHGTTEKALGGIKKSGLKTGKKPLYKQSDSESVYLTNGFRGAVNWARNATTYGGKPVVVEVRIPKSQLDKIAKDAKTNSGNTSTDYSYGGTIPREWIRGHYAKYEDGFGDVEEWGGNGK